MAWWWSISLFTTKAASKGSIRSLLWTCWSGWKSEGTCMHTHPTRVSWVRGFNPLQVTGLPLCTCLWPAEDIPYGGCALKPSQLRVACCCGPLPRPGTSERHSSQSSSHRLWCRLADCCTPSARVDSGGVLKQWQGCSCAHNPSPTPWLPPFLFSPCFAHAHSVWGIPT